MPSGKDHQFFVEEIAGRNSAGLEWCREDPHRLASHRAPQILALRGVGQPAWRPGDGVRADDKRIRDGERQALIKREALGLWRVPGALFVLLFSCSRQVLLTVDLETRANKRASPCRPLSCPGPAAGPDSCCCSSCSSSLHARRPPTSSPAHRPTLWAFILARQP